MKEGVKDSSPGLVFHCHGGGFVAQSSRSHETYLRQWATSISAPILSVDYSLAPEAPFPRALDEVYYAYCWALTNTLSLGSTGERIVLAGILLIVSTFFVYPFISNCFLKRNTFTV